MSIFLSRDSIRYVERHSTLESRILLTKHGVNITLFNWVKLNKKGAPSRNVLSEQTTVGSNGADMKHELECHGNRPSSTPIESKYCRSIFIQWKVSIGLDLEVSSFLFYPRSADGID